MDAAAVLPAGERLFSVGVLDTNLKVIFFDVSPGYFNERLFTAYVAENRGFTEGSNWRAMNGVAMLLVARFGGFYLRSSPRHPQPWHHCHAVCESWLLCVLLRTPSTAPPTRPVTGCGRHSSIYSLNYWTCMWCHSSRKELCKLATS